MKLTTLINEARRNPEVNQTLTPIEHIRYLHNKTSSTIAGSVTNLFISMTVVDKLGINPKSTYDTPIGIYSYQTDYVLSTVKQNLTELPFMGHAPLVSIFKTTNPNSILILNDMTSSDVEFYLSKIKNIQEFVVHIPQETNRARVQTPGGIFWYITMMVARGVASVRSRAAPIVWNTIFRKLGIDGCVDIGAGIIHPAEKSQAVFFKLDSISVISQIKNKLVNTREQLSNILDRALTLGKTNRKPEIEKVILTNPEFAFKYAQDVIGGVWPAAESIIATSPEYSFYYARYLRNSTPWPMGEPAIATNSYYSMLYAVHVLNNRFPLGEPAIASGDILSATKYDNKFGTNFVSSVNNKPKIAKESSIKYYKKT